ncbi:unnamed protein product [Paramecium sonneborni]|uniref:Uncharacterized protein n=1 Tax=Paramecium sonneborni TaxID=65129 RepID=A0A8S1MKM7_9CILI|nr:unnamed protein product [Paramecium sonneborni]
MIQVKFYIFFTLNFHFILLNSQVEWEKYYNAFNDNNMSEIEFWSQNTGIQNLIYSCEDKKMFGGYGIFGSKTIVSKQFILPPHFKIKIKLDFWKLDSWDGEFIQIISDEIVYQQKYIGEGSQICGNQFNDFIVEFDYTFLHNSEILNFVMRDTLDENGYNESWGIRNFLIFIQKCPNSCIICHEDANECYTQDQADHFKNNKWQNLQSIPISSTQCVQGINIIGGYEILDKFSVINSKFSVSPHYQIRIQIQFILIDIESLNNSFDFDFDGEIVNFQLSTKSQFSICSKNPQESFNNLEYAMNHAKEEMSITIKPKSLEGARPFWGILSFNLLIFKCPKNCQKCVNQDICLLCIDEWVVENNYCNRLQNPFKVIYFSIQQVFYPVNFQPQVFNQSIILKKIETFLNLNISISCNQNYLIQIRYVLCHSCKNKITINSKYVCERNKIQGIVLNIKLKKLMITSEEVLIKRNNTNYELIQIFYNNEMKQEKIIEIIQKVI